MDVIATPLLKVFDRFPDMVVYAFAVPVVLIVLFIGRLVLRSLVNKRVRSIGVGPVGFGELEKMRDEGLISDEEFRVMRKSSAQQQLEGIQGPAAGLSAEQMLASIESDLSSAQGFIQPVSEGAQKSLRGLGQKFIETESGELIPAPTETPRTVQPQYGQGSPQAGARGPGSQSAPSRGQRPAQGTPGEMHASGPSGQAARRPPLQAAQERPNPRAAKPSSGGTELDVLLQKGLITKEEYDRLAGLYKKAREGE